MDTTQPRAAGPLTVGSNAPIFQDWLDQNFLSVDEAICPADRILIEPPELAAVEKQVPVEPPIDTAPMLSEKEVRSLICDWKRNVAEGTPRMHGGLLSRPRAAELAEGYLQ